MGLLQLYLRRGKQSVSLNNNIPKGAISVKHVYTSFNVKYHGFYMASIDFPFLYQNNAQSNTTKRGILIPCKHDETCTFQELNFRLGETEIPRNFEVIVDLDNGHQVVLESDARSGGSFPFTTNPSLPYYSNEDYVLNPGGYTPGTYVSLGLNAERLLDGTIPESSGVIDGPQPFMYAMILTLEYDDGLVEERLQQLLS